MPDENIAKTENKGIEITLTYNRVSGDFRWQIGGNFTYNKSKIIDVQEPVDVLDWQKQTGRPIGVFDDPLYYDAIGIFRSQEELDAYPHLVKTGVGDLKFRDVNEDGVIDGNDRIRLDKTDIPQIIYGIPLSFGYRNWDLNMLWQGAGRVVQNVFFESGSIGNFTKDFAENRWTADNPDADYPRVYDRAVTGTGEANTFWVKDASYLRLKNIQLAYTLSESLVEKLPFESLMIYASAYNLLTIDKLKYIDPEGRASGQGFAGWFTPQSRVFNVGLNVSF